MLWCEVNDQTTISMEEIHVVSLDVLTRPVPRNFHSPGGGFDVSACMCAST